VNGPSAPALGTTAGPCAIIYRLRPIVSDPGLDGRSAARMSRNLVEIIRRHHELAAPSALEVLKDGDVVDAGPGATARVLAGTMRAAGDALMATRRR
jgi:hypothetical protein